MESAIQPLQSVLLLTEDALLALKTRYAEMRLRDPEKTPFATAREIIGWERHGPALQMATEWECDSFVVETKERLIDEHGEDYYMPTRNQLAREVLTAARNAIDSRGQVGLYTLASQLRGFIGSGGGSVTVNTDNSRKVLEVHTHESVDAWKQAARAQQIEVTTGA